MAQKSQKTESQNVDLQDLIDGLTLDQKREVLHRLQLEKSKRFERKATACVHCGSTKIRKMGTKKKKNETYQRLQCKECKRTFSSKSQTVQHYSKKDHRTWAAFFNALAAGLSIRDTARRVNISPTTAFYWRHKTLSAIKEVLNERQRKLDDIIQMDETYVRVSFKGQKGRGYSRASAKKREAPKRKRGLSKQQVCVLTAMDKNDSTFIKPVCLGVMDSSALQHTLSYSPGIGH